MGEDSNEFCKCAKGEDDEEADVENKVGDTVEGRTHGVMVVTYRNQFRICIRSVKKRTALSQRGPLYWD